MVVFILLFHNQWVWKKWFYPIFSLKWDKNDIFGPSMTSQWSKIFKKFIFVIQGSRQFDRGTTRYTLGAYTMLTPIWPLVVEKTGKNWEKKWAPSKSCFLMSLRWSTPKIKRDLPVCRRLPIFCKLALDYYAYVQNLNIFHLTPVPSRNIKICALENFLKKYFSKKKLGASRIPKKRKWVFWFQKSLEIILMVILSFYWR